MVTSYFHDCVSNAKFVACGLRGLTRRSRQRQSRRGPTARAARDPTARAVDREGKTPDGSRRRSIDGLLPMRRRGRLAPRPARHRRRGCKGDVGQLPSQAPLIAPPSQAPLQPSLAQLLVREAGRGSPLPLPLGLSLPRGGEGRGRGQQLDALARRTGRFS